MNPYVAEFIGTALLIIFGNGVVANVLLARTKGHNSGWIVITAGWAFGVYVGAFCSAKYSGAHLNPAITVALIANGSIEFVKAIGYIIAQILGGMLGATMVFLFYREHFKISENPDEKLACFCTAPNIRNLPQAFFCEVVGTFVLMFPLLLVTSPSFMLPAAVGEQEIMIGLGTLGLIPVSLLVFGIGLSLGGTTGYAINPARDLGPRIAHALLPIPGKRDSDWGYSWAPVIGPIFGALLAVLVFAIIT
ncbi:MAG: aquaporin family protein [Candidatus Omnitrophota bacterium]|jgi:glycerol uptake facilitator protein|nr:MAG: aquaporin family protein [Candidatus Omnitrophota bacterium]